MPTLEYCVEEAVLQLTERVVVACLRKFAVRPSHCVSLDKLVLRLRAHNLIRKVAEIAVPTKDAGTTSSGHRDKVKVEVASPSSQG